MDLKTECSELEIVEDNEIKDNHLDDHKVRDNGSCDPSASPDGLAAENHLKDAAEAVQPMHSPTLAATSPAGSSPSTTKGYGLKKWRRIKRDFVRDAPVTVDSGKILKRPGSASSNPAKPQHMGSPEIRQNSESPIAPANILKNASVSVLRSPSLDSRFAVGAVFAAAAATDSENSEDRSSRSSTAASLPKARYDLPGVLGYVNEKNQMKNFGGKSVVNSSQRVQQGKARVESSKKPRGERVKIEKENSHSSMESDSRSSNFVFMQGPFAVSSNGKQSGKSMNYDGENSDEAHEGEHTFSEEVQTAYRKENSGEIEELSVDDLAAEVSWEAKEEKSDNCGPSSDQDPLVESILALQSVEEALGSEVQKLREIGKEPTSLHDDLTDIKSVPMDSTFAGQEICETNSSEKIRSTSGSAENEVFTLTQRAKYLESKLDEARAVLQAKELRISELETSAKSTAGLQQDKYTEMEFDLESLFQQKMEAEIELLALTTAVKKLRVSVGNQITLFEEQASLAGEQERMLNKLGETESKAALLKKQAEELEKHCGNVLGTEEVLIMQRRVCKVTSCFLTQLVLLLLLFWFVVLQLSPHSGVDVPT